MAKYETHAMRSSWLQEFWHYRELFYFLIWRNVKIKYKQSVLGASWAVIRPFLTMIVFTLFFGRFAKMPNDGIPYPIFYYSALVPWTFFTEALTFSGNSLVANANLLTKVYFPRVTIPAAAVLSGLLDFAIASVVLVGMMIYYNIPFSLSQLLWPVLILPLVFLALGTGMAFAALNVRYRDIKYTLPFVVQVWLFLTPVIYPTSIIPERFRFLAALNPTSGIIEAFRACLLPTRQVNWKLLGIGVMVTLVIFLLSTVYFWKTEKEFADII